MKIIVLGGSGMWGHQAFLKLSTHFGQNNVACTLRKPKDYYDKIQIYKNSPVYDQVDFRFPDSAFNCLNDFKPDWVINCVGLTPRKYDVKNEPLFYQINAELPHLLATWVRDNKSKLIHFSTDCVFTGKKGNYTENDIPDAQDVYGRSKAQGEVKAPRVLTYRLSKIGREIEGKTEIVEWLLSQKGKAVKGFSRAFYSGLTTNYMAEELIRMIDNFPHLEGLYQVSSHKITKYELLKLINDVYHCGVEIQENSEYAVDKSLSCDAYSEATGFKKPHWLEMIKNMKNEERIDYDGFK